MSNMKLFDHEYNGAPCRIYADYGSVLMIEFDTGSRTAVPKSKVVKTLQGVINAASIIKPKSDVTAAVKGEAPQQEVIATSESTKKPNINDLTFSDLVDLKGVGRSSAKKIIENKPVGGYNSIEQLQGLNSELTRLDWGVVENQISFE